MRGSLALSISQYYRMLLFRTCSPTAEASGLSPVQCEFESHQVYFPVRYISPGVLMCGNGENGRRSWLKPSWIQSIRVRISVSAFTPDYSKGTEAILRIS